MTSELMKKDFFARLKTTYKSLTKSEKKVGDLILGTPLPVIEMSLAEVASKCNVSDATAMRFSRSLGYQGWLELKIALIRSLPEAHTEITSDKSEMKSQSLFQRIVTKSKEALDETFLAFDDQGFNEIVGLILNAGKILIAGSGTSGPIAHELYNRLFRLGLNCTVESDSMLQVMHSSLLSSKDILIVVSQSGESSSIARIAEIARKTGAPVVTITGSRLSGLAKLSDYLLLSVCHEPNPETVSSRIAQHAIVHALYYAVSEKIGLVGTANEDKIWDAFFPGDS